MGWPDSTVKLTGFVPDGGSKFDILGTDESAAWEYSQEGGLLITIPESMEIDPDSPMSYTCVIKVTE